MGTRQYHFSGQNELKQNKSLTEYIMTLHCIQHVIHKLYYIIAIASDMYYKACLLFHKTFNCCN